MALTDAAGTVTYSYAYTPYGQLLQRTGSSVQPFTFVGKWGVRQEGTSGTLYHMRVRYYDTIAARFLSREFLWPDIANPRRLNPYQYASATPISRIDPNETVDIGVDTMQKFRSLVVSTVRSHTKAEVQDRNFFKNNPDAIELELLFLQPTVNLVPDSSRLDPNNYNKDFGPFESELYFRNLFE